MPRWRLGSWTIYSACSPSLSRALHLPKYRRDVFAHPDPKADIAKPFVQPAPIPGTSPQMHGPIRAAAVAILAPILRGQRRHIKRRAAQDGQVHDGACGLCIRQVLQHVIANYQVIWRARCKVDDRAMRPAESAAQILARLEPHVASTRQELLEGFLQQADAAAGIEDSPHRNLTLPQGARDERSAAAHLRGRDDTRRRVQIEFSEIGRAKIVRGRPSVYLTCSFLPPMSRGFIHA